MNSLKLIAVFSSIIVSLILLVIITYFLTKSFKSKINGDGKLKLSFSIWYATIFLSGASIISCMIDVILEVIDNLIKIQPANFNIELIKGISLIIGVSFGWFILWFFVVKFLSRIIPIKVDEYEEMEDDNYSYFVLKGAILIGIILSLSSVLSLILRMFIPNVEIPFYH